MDSLGGGSKALMIPNISPAMAYVEETMTLNYPARAMMIKNKPIIYVDNKEQILYNLKRKIQLLKLENEYLKEKLRKITGMSVEASRSSAFSTKSESNKLPALAKASYNATSIIQEYDFEKKRLKEENLQLTAKIL